MANDRRVNRGSLEPLPDGPPEQRRWSDYLDWMREEIISGVLQLAATDQTASRLPSGWSPLELLNHVRFMEQRWFVWGFLGEAVPEPWGDWNVDDPTAEATAEDRTAAWSVSPGSTVDDIVQELRDVGQRTRDVLQTYQLHDTARLGGRFTESGPTLEWICFHVVTEYSRHAGHLDIVRELAQHSPAD